MAAVKKKSISMSISPMEKIDNDWRAESDARVLIDAEKIREDTTRLAAAIKYAKTKIEQLKGIIQDGAVELLEDDDDSDD